MYGDNGRPLEHCTSAYAVVHQRSSSIQQLHIVVHHSVPARFTRIVAVSPYRQATAGPHCKFRFLRTWIRVQRGLEVHIARQYRAAPHYTSPPGGDPSRQGHARVSGLLPPGACWTPDSVNAPPAGWVVHTRPSQSPLGHAPGRVSGPHCTSLPVTCPHHLAPGKRSGPHSRALLMAPED